MPLNPQDPTKQPKDFTAGVFSPLAASDTEDQQILQWTIHQASTLQASITAGSDVFQITSFNVYQWTAPDPAFRDFPGRVQPWYFNPVGTDNQQPMDAPAASVLQIYVRVSPPVNSASSPVTGTLTATIGTSTRTVELTAVCLFVDLSSKIGIKYVALGGAAFTGKPTGAPEPGLNGAGTIQHFQNGSIWDLPTAGTFFISPQIYAAWNDPAWQDLLGTPSDDSFATAETGQAQRFSKGMMVIRPGRPALIVYGDIYVRYAQMFDGNNPHAAPWVGWPTTDALTGAAANVLHQSFDAAEIQWSAATGAQLLMGAIRDRWNAANLFASLGMPAGEEIVAPDGLGRYQRFERGQVVWHPNFDAHEVPAPTLDLWQNHGGLSGWLGYPQSIAGPTVRFQYGSIGVDPQGAPFTLPDARTFSQQVLTPPGTALGGNVSLTVRSDGTWDFRCDMRDTGADDYSFTVTAILSTGLGTALALQKSGSVQGHVFGDGGREVVLTEGNSDPSPDPASQLVVGQQIMHIQEFWPEILAGQFNVSKAYKDTGALGAIESVFSDLVPWAAAAVTVGMPVTFLICLGDELGKHLAGSALGLPGVVGVTFAAGAVLIMGPVGFTVGAIAGLVVGEAVEALFKHRSMQPDEYAFASTFFNGKLPPIDRFVVTNVSFAKGTNGDFRAFTCPGLGDQIFLNMGPDWFDYPLTNKRGNGDHYAHPGQVYVHELTHAWQIYNRSFVPGWLCDVITKKRAAVGIDDPYSYGTPGTPWHEFGIEQQAHIVDDWYGGSRGDAYGHKRSNGMEDIEDPFFHFITNNIRGGNTD